MCSDPTTNYPIHEWAHALRGSYPILGWHLIFRMVINKKNEYITPHTLNKNGVRLPCR
jgi:hypothetical protein